MVTLTRSPLGLGRRSICMSKSIADMMPSPNSSSIRAWHAGAAHRHLVEQRGLGRAQAEQLARLGGLRLGQLHLAEQCAHQQHRRIAADLLADMLPAPALLALDVENLFGESGAIHLWVSCSLDSILPTDPPGVIPAGRRPARGPGSMYPSFCSFRTPGYLGPGSRRCRGSPGMTAERMQALAEHAHDIWMVPW